MVDIEELSRIANINTVLAFYGIYPNRAGFIPCFVHKEKTASMKVYENQNCVHCYGCGAHLGPIDVVKEMEHCSFLEAVHKLKVMFGIKNDARSEKELRKRLKEIEKQKIKEQQKKDNLNKIIGDLYLEYDNLENQYNKLVPEVNTPEFKEFRNKSYLVQRTMNLGLKIIEVKDLIEDLRFMQRIIEKKIPFEDLKEYKIFMFERLKKWQNNKYSKRY